MVGRGVPTAPEKWDLRSDLPSHYWNADGFAIRKKRPKDETATTARNTAPTPYSSFGQLAFNPFRQGGVDDPAARLFCAAVLPDIVHYVCGTPSPETKNRRASFPARRFSAHRLYITWLRSTQRRRRAESQATPSSPSNSCYSPERGSI